VFPRTGKLLKVLAGDTW